LLKVLLIHDRACMHNLYRGGSGAFHHNILSINIPYKHFCRFVQQKNTSLSIREEPISVSHEQGFWMHALRSAVLAFSDTIGIYQ